jgi:FKBP-type peptidyl-prolyl cis-trans isomerase
MATKKSQRIGIIIILVALVVGTLGSFAIMVLAQQNQSTEAAKQQEATAKYEQAAASYQAAVDKQSAELSDKYYQTLSPYASRVATFDRDAVTELKKDDLVVGDGAEIAGNTPIGVYYIGWNPKGKIFDQSIKEGRLIAPFPFASGIDNGGVIEGWISGLKGMRIGGIRELTIPSDLAYGEQDKGDDIPPNTPLKFVVMAIAAPETIPVPDVLQNLGGLQQ